MTQAVETELRWPRSSVEDALDFAAKLGGFSRAVRRQKRQESVQGQVFCASCVIHGGNEAA